MKSKLIFFFLWLLPVGYAPAFAQTKHALIFAISNYPRQGGWSPLSGNRDVYYLRQTLLKQSFLPANIKTVTEAAVTPQGITTALEGLISRSKPGDIALIHFSTHGEQIEDDNNDESDGLDESIVTYYAIKPQHSLDFKKDQALYFRDDLFGMYIDRLRKKIGAEGDVVVFLDLCHSGSGTRGMAKIRGAEPPFVSAQFDYKRNATGQDVAGVFREKNAEETDGQAGATYVVFSAARAGEASFEITDETNQGMGALTYAVSKAFETLSPQTTYRTLFSKIKSIVHDKRPGQNPALEGNGLDRTLFGGRQVWQKPYVDVQKIAGKEMTLGAGKLIGLDSGAQVSLYPAGTLDPAQAKPVATATVLKAGYYQSVARLDAEPGIRQPALVWAFVTETVYVMEPVPVYIQSSRADELKKNLAGMPLLRFEGEPELLIVQGPLGDSIKIASSGFLFMTTDNMAGVSHLKEGIRHYLQYKYLQGLEISSREVGVDVQLVPVVHGRADTSAIELCRYQGSYVFHPGDTITLWIKNTAAFPVYINVLDLQPDGKINAVLPNKKRKIYPEDLRIEAGQARLFQAFPLLVSPPYGTEIFKIFVSRKNIDMERVVEARQEVIRGRRFSLEQLVERAFEMNAQPRVTENINSAEGSIYSLLFEIKKGKRPDVFWMANGRQ